MPKNLKDEILLIGQGIDEQISRAKSVQNLEDIRISAFGKKGKITSYLKKLKSFDQEKRIELGSVLNDIKNNLFNSIEDKKQIIINLENTSQLSIFVLGIIILIISFWFIKSTLKEGRRALEDVNRNNNKSSDYRS